MQLDAPIIPRRRMSMTSLIDVVFLLLVFFMLASTFAQYSRIHVAGSAPGRAASAVQGAHFVRLHRDGRVDLNGSPLALVDLAAAISRSEAAPERRVIVRPLAGADVQQLVAVLEAVRRGQPQQIILAR